MLDWSVDGMLCW